MSWDILHNRIIKDLTVLLEKSTWRSQDLHLICFKSPAHFLNKSLVRNTNKKTEKCRIHKKVIILLYFFTWSVFISSIFKQNGKIWNLNYFKIKKCRFIIQQIFSESHEAFHKRFMSVSRPFHERFTLRVTFRLKISNNLTEK